MQGREVRGYRLVAQQAPGLWRGYDAELDRSVALKEVLLSELGSAARLRQEARVLAGLLHPQLVGVIDLVEDDDRLWLVEEWVDGLTLAEVIAREGRLTAVQSAGVIRGALLGLAYAHERGVVHGDVAPTNLLLDVTGTSRLVDFGLARPAGEAGVAGTPGYLSPEAAHNLPLLPASDVYSAAAVLAFLLRGRPLYDGPTSAVVLAAQFAPGEPDLTEVTPPLRPLLRAALSRDPEQRPADAAAFLADFEVAAEESFGAGWLARAGLAGVVSAAIGAGTTAVVSGGSSTAASPGASGASGHTGVTGAYGARTAGRLRSVLGTGPGLSAVVAAVVAVVAVVVGITMVTRSAGEKDGEDRTAAAPIGAGSATPAGQRPVDLATVDWSAETFPGTACVNAATSADQVALGAGVPFTGQVQDGDPQPFIANSALPPSYGELADGTEVALILVTCIPEGAIHFAGIGVLAYAADPDGPRLLGAFANGELGEVPDSDFWLLPTVLSVVNGTVTVDGVYLRDNDSMAGPSGRGWTTLEYADGALTPSGVIHIGERPNADPSGGAGEPETIWFDPPVLIHAEADLINLTGTPDDFRQYVWQQAQAVLANCPDDPRAGIAVVNYRGDGYGLGTRQCQGNSFGELWAAREGTWALVVATNELLPCDPLRDYAYPMELLERHAAPLCGEADGSVSDYPGEEAATPPTTAPPGTGGALIEYDLTVAAETDVALLHDAPEDFKDFIAGRYRDLAGSNTWCRTRAEVYVGRLRTDGFATGAEGCQDGGAALIWVRVDGTWQEVLGTQDTWDCAGLRAYQVPAELIGEPGVATTTCFDYAGDQQLHEYTQP